MNRIFSSLRWLLALCLIGSFAFSNGLQAQEIEQKAKRKVKRRVDNRVDDAVDDGIDGALNAIEGIFSGKKKKQKTERPSEETPSPTESSSGVKIGTDEDVTVTIGEDTEADTRAVEPSEFIGSYTMEMSEYKKGKLEKDHPVLLTYHIDTYQFAMEVKDSKQQENSTIIYDRKNRKMITKVDDKDKTATILKMPNIMLTVESTSTSTGKYSVTPTGRTKNIQGYICKEYMIETEEEISHVWFAEELSLNLANSMNMVRVKNQQGTHTADYTNLYNISGTWLESHTESKHDNTSREVYIKNLTVGAVSPRVFSLDGYQVTDMSSLNIFGND